MKEINIKHMNSLHSDALRSLDFYKQDIKILRNRLEEITADYTSREVAVMIEHFQNQFLIQQYNIDELKHKLHDNLSNIQNQVMEYAGFISETSSAENVDLYDQYLTIEKLVNEIRQEFNRFASKWM
jgi:hypothetical protein